MHVDLHLAAFLILKHSLAREVDNQPPMQQWVSHLHNTMFYTSTQIHRHDTGG